MIWLIGPVVGVLAGYLALQWALGSHRRDRAPWLELLSIPAEQAMRSGDLGALDGLASDGGEIPALTAPFSGRPCLAFHVEMIVKEQFGNRTRWTRVLEDGHGQFFVSSDEGKRRGWANFEGGRLVFPTPLDEYTKLSLVATPETVFHGKLERAPENLQRFVEEQGDELLEYLKTPSGNFLAGKHLFFNERIVAASDRVIVAGRCEESAAGTSVIPTEEIPVYLAKGSLESERARLAKLPVAGESFGAVMGGVLACAGVEMIVGMLFAK